MTQARISGLNYDAVQGTEDYQAYRQVVEDEIITRFKMNSGFPYQPAQFGILDVVNPAQITVSETGRALRVYVSSENALAISMDPGYAICPSGSILQVASFQQQITLASVLLSGKTYAICLEAVIDSAAGTSQLNDYNVPQYSQELVVTQIKSIEYQSGWVPTENQVVLAMVRIVDKTGGGQELQIDLTQNTYAFNRPWYSVVDTQHRSQVGSGAVTARNPHGTSINDLTVPGTVGVFQGLTGQGLVISRDSHKNKVLGANLCLEQISFSDIKVDVGGTVTKGSPYNKVNALYVELDFFPLRLGSVYDLTTPANAISAEVIPNTNILVFGPNENITAEQTIQIVYTTAQALLPPSIVTSNFLTFQQPVANEVIVSGGFTYPTVQEPTISMEGTGPFARKYTAYFLGSGVIAAYPQVLAPSQNALVPLPQTLIPQFPARISVGLTNTTGSPGLEVQVTITGLALDEPGNANSTTSPVTENLIFTPASGYVDQVVPSTSYDLPGQILVTDRRYTQVEAISVMAIDAGPNPQIQIWAEIEPGSSPDLNDALVIGDIKWNGQAVVGMTDRRRVQKQWTGMPSVLSAVGETELDAVRLFNHMETPAPLAQSSIRLFTEDFEDLRYFDMERGFILPTKAVGTLGLNSSISLLAGDTITLSTSPSRILTAVSSTPTLPGQFEVGTPLVPIPISMVIDNLVNAINDPAFDSRVYAEVNMVNPLNISLELQSPLGVVANSVVLSAVTTNSGALSVSGFNFAVDGFGECYMNRHCVGLDSPLIPDNSNLNPYQYAYRNRYRSRAFSLPSSLGAQTQFAIQVHGEDRYADSSLRIRGSRFTNPKVWNAWQFPTVAPAGTKGLYVVTFSQAVHKVQVEFYGKARGISVYMVRG